MSKLYIRDNSYTRDLTEADPEDRFSRSSTETSHSIEWISLDKRANEYLDLDYTPKAGVSYFLVWAIYCTGDSFGHDSGRIEFIDLFKNKEDAEQCKDTLEQAEGFSTRLKSASGKNYTFSIPWNGYFEHLESVEIQEFKIS